MPIREGRWVPWAEVIAEQKAVEEEAAATAPPEEPPTVKRPRRSRRAAEAAITKATGADVSVAPATEETY